MNLDQIKKTIERRGYIVDLLPQDEEYPRRYEVLFIRRIQKGIVASISWAITHRMLEQMDEFFLREVVEQILFTLAQGQHHMQHVCGYPVLRDTIEWDTRPSFEYSTRELMRFAPHAITRVRTHVYRCVQAGPESEELEYCPKCGTLLVDEAIKEIA